jgi:pre-mRNA-splicing factor SYF1
MDDAACTLQAALRGLSLAEMSSEEEWRISNAYCQREWWNTIQVLTTFKEKSRVFEQALGYVPGSYKIWHHYLEDARAYVRDSNPTPEWYQHANALHERALGVQYSRPRIWIEYLEFLIEQGQITKTRRTFDQALQQLPITQHDLVWDVVLGWAADLPVKEVTRQLYLRYMPSHPGFLPQYLDFLEKKGFYAEVTSRLFSMLQEPGTDLALWENLCQIVAEHPTEIELDCEAVLKEALEKSSLEAGKVWQLQAEAQIRKGDLEGARSVYEEAVDSVTTMRDFGLVFAAYSQFEEELLLEAGEESEELEEQIGRVERLTYIREEWVSNVRLRINPNDVQEWEQRVQLFKDDTAKMLETYAQAVSVVDPGKASKPQFLWIHMARLYDKANDLDNCRQVLWRAVNSKFKKPEHHAAIWIEWVELELVNRHYDDALKIVRWATSNKEGGNKDSLKLWQLRADLEESLGTVESTKAAYKKLLDLKLATPHTILNFAAYLQAHNYFEEAFRAYERGVNTFAWPHAYDLWVAYLTSFTLRYGSSKLERARELFEQVLTVAPKAQIKLFYFLYAQLEEEYGLINHAIEVYDKALRDVPDNEKLEVFNVYMQKAVDFFGIGKTRALYEEAYSLLTEPRDIIEAGLKFAQIERKLGEIDRCRALYGYLADYSNPRHPEDEKYWKAWNEFEIYHGNRETYSEMMRTKRTVITKYSSGSFLHELDNPVA